jgi:hypothetical protein
MKRFLNRAYPVALLCVTLLTIVEACAGQSLASTAARTPDRFFSDLRDLVEHGDLGDEEYVAQTFRLQLTAEPSETVFNPTTKSVEGVSSKFIATAKSVETQIFEGKPKANYGQFKPNGSTPEKSSFTEAINEAEICLKKEQFTPTWGEGEPQWNPSFQGQITYIFSRRNELEIYLLFSKTGCLHEITLFQNRRDELK